MTRTGVACLALLLVPAVQSARGLQPPSNPAPAQPQTKPTVEIVIPTPEPRTFELALDEIELDWSQARRTAHGDREAAVAVPGTAIVSHDQTRTVVRVDGARNVVGLKQILAATATANPGSRSELVVYEPGRPRAEASRRLLTSDVALLLEDGVTLQDAIAGVDGIDAQAVRGTPRGYVVRCADPLAAVALARALGSVTGVKRAYPLLKRTRATR